MTGTPRRGTILLVDDEPGLREAMSEALMLEKFEVVACGTGRDALDLLAKQTFDLMLLDLIMPGMTGFAVLEEVRKRFAPVDLPVIVTTAMGSREHILQAFALGASDYITKPVDLGIFLARIRAHATFGQTARELERASDAQRSFLASMSHEFGTPLNAILGATQALEEASLDPDQRTQVALLRRSAENLRLLTGDLLDLAKMDADQIHLESHEFDLVQSLQWVLDDCRPKAELKKVELRVDIAEEVRGIFLGDPIRVKQILRNLVDNAIKFTDRGYVSVTVRSVGDVEGAAVVELVVEDTGAGVPAEAKPRIFARFSRMDDSSTRRHRGAGSGLTITSYLVQIMNGRIEMESEAGQGSRFVLQIPLKRVSTSAVPPATPVPGADGITKSLLLVEDSPDNRLVVMTYLKQTPYRLSMAENGRVGFEMFINEKYDLVLMDLQMPEMDGLQATAAMRSWEAARGSPHTPILVLTAHTLREEGVRAHLAGCDEFLTKPISKRALLQALARHLPSHERPAPPDEGSRNPKDLFAHVDAEFRSLIPEYVSNREEDALRLRLALSRGEYATIRVLGHNMKGSGAAFGFPDITALGTALDAAAASEKGDDVDAVLRKFEQFLRDLRGAMPAWLAS